MEDGYSTAMLINGMFEVDCSCSEAIDLEQKLFAQLTAENAMLQEALEILSSIWFYGNFKAETYNEIKLQKIMEQINLWPTTEDEIIQRAGGGE